MKQTIKLITTILFTFLIPLITSILLDWPWVAKAWPRYALIVLLMLLEIIIGCFAFYVVALEKEVKFETEN